MDVKSLPLFKHPERFLNDSDASGHGRKLGLKGLQPSSQRTIADTFEKGTVTGASTTDQADKTQSGEAQLDSSGLNISFQFDLFYELSQKVSAKMGQRGLSRFTEVASQVTETFKGRFSLSIDPVGSFMKGTDAALNISADTTNDFLDSVEGLAELSPAALENFLRESDRFFGELEKTYGSADGAFDGIRDQIQTQASQFFADVKTAQEAMIAPEKPALPDGQQAPAVVSGDDALPLVFSDGSQVSQDQYQDFLKGFQDYVRRFREQMMKDFLTTLHPREQTTSRKPLEESAAAAITAKPQPEEIKPIEPAKEQSAAVVPESAVPGGIEVKA